MINSVLVKPAGPDCNLRCNYCFYRQKAGLFGGKYHRMSDRVLEELISQCMDLGVTTFSWQGGEPALMGLDFFKKVVELEIRYGAPGTTVANAFQTNGTLLDSDWARFLAEYNFLVGLSIDGPAELHDYYRRDAAGRGTHRRVMDTARILRQHGVEFNILALVNNVNVREPDAVWDFFVGNGFSYLQFVPCVEPGGGGKPAPFSITPEEFGQFLIAIFDRWVEEFPNVSVRDFDDLLAHELGMPPGTCTVSRNCGSYVVVEHNGDVFACDFFVTARWRLGNLLETHLAEIIRSERFAEFARAKSEYGSVCRSCKYLEWCYGGCQKHRIVLGGQITDPSYFCRSYRTFFAHALPRIPELVQRLRELGRV